MILKKLYSEPNDLFDTIEFRDGINFVFGEKSASSDPKESLNGIGKSTLLDLIDFALLSSYTKNHNPRLFSAHDILTNHQIVLEFEVEDKTYVIKRTVDSPNKAHFGEIDSLQEYSRKELCQMLTDLVFKKQDYSGVYSDRWWRRLINFYVKIQSQKKAKFTEPVKYIDEMSVAELNQYLFFLMGLDNTLVAKNFDIQWNLKKRTKAIIEVKQLVEETYGLKDISEASNEIDRLKQDVKDIENTISQFKLSTQYEDAEKQANKLTAEIKELWYLNFSDRKKIDTYQESLKIDVDIDIAKVKRIYEEFNQLLAEKVSATLEQAVEFRKNLIDSRKDFISSELVTITEQIKQRESKITQLESERAKLFSFLSNKEAISDLSDAYLLLSKKKDQQGELSGKIRLYNDLQKEKADLKVEAAKMEKLMLDFIEKHTGTVSEFRTIFRQVYNEIYPDNKDTSMFTLDVKPATDAVINIDITFPAMFSKGKNQGRTLVFDLAVLLNSIERNYPGPRFLIHDGIFDGVDKAHFVSLYRYLEDLKTKTKFQYVVTLNEEGTLNEKFGNVDELSPDNIKSKAVIVLTPKKKLLGRNF